MEVVLGQSPSKSPGPKRRSSISPRRRLSSGFIHDYLERNKAQKHDDSGGNFSLPVRLPHSLSQKDEEAAKFVIAQSKVEPPSEEMLEILPNICSCLFGLCGLGCGLDLCAIIPRLCSFFAGLCGSLNDSGISSGQNYTPMTVQVLLAIISFNPSATFCLKRRYNSLLANCIYRTFKIVDQKKLL